MMIDWQNLVDENGIIIAVAGMAIVFSALAVISVSIWLLPRAMEVVNRIHPEQHEPHVSAQSASRPEGSEDASIAAAIGYAMHLEPRKGK